MNFLKKIIKYIRSIFIKIFGKKESNSDIKHKGPPDSIYPMW